MATPGEWAAATVAAMLDNPVYAGRLRLREGDDVIDGEHAAIVDESTWRKARQLRAARQKRDRGRPPNGQHLFRHGLLRCGECGGAMVPRTNNGGTEVYVCRGRAEHDCAASAIPRKPIDTATFRYFERIGLDVEATRRQVADARDRKLAEVRALRAQAEREAQRARETYDRIRGDVKRGDIPAKEWREEWRDELTEEREAAEAEAERLRAKESEVESWGELRDAEGDTLRRLAEVPSGRG